MHHLICIDIDAGSCCHWLANEDESHAFVSLPRIGRVRPSFRHDLHTAHLHAGCRDETYGVTQKEKKYH